VAAFVGFAAKGPFDEPTLVTNWGQFTENFGEFVEGFYLAQSVYGYFLNGGTACYMVRIGGGCGTARRPSCRPARRRGSVATWCAPGTARTASPPVTWPSR